MSETPDAHKRMRVAIYAADGTVRGLMSASLATITANTPPGGSWRELPASVRRVADVRRVDPRSVERTPSVGSAASSPKGGAS